MRKANLADIKNALDSGGSLTVRHWDRVSWITFTDALGAVATRVVEGHSYNSFLRSIAAQCERVENGSTETAGVVDDLTITWSKTKAATKGSAQ